MRYTVKFYTEDDFMFCVYTTYNKRKALARIKYMDKLNGYAEMHYVYA